MKEQLSRAAPESPSEIASAERAAARKKQQDDKKAAKAVKKSPQTKAPTAKPAKKTAGDKVKKAAPAVLVSSKKPTNLPPPTTHIASEFQQAFEFFNSTLFDNVLPNCVIVVDRLKKANGMFCPKRWDMRDGKKDFHEIRIDTTRLAKDGKGDKDVLGTLVHEMAHLAVEHSGKGPKRAYHCKNWARLMNEIGLKPYAIVKGKPVRDKETGANCSHDIVKGGAFDAAADDFMQSGFSFSWATMTDPPKEKTKSKKAGAKVAHECPKCGDKAWGKSSLKLTCGKDKVPMVCEDAGDDDDGDGDDE